MKALLISTCLLAAATSAVAQISAPSPAPASAPTTAPAAQALPAAPIVASGTLPDEASKAALLARLRDVYGAGRVVDQLAVGPVSMPANWNEYLHKLINPNLKMVTRGQLKVDGSMVTLRGDVADEAQRQQIANDIDTSLNPTYTVNNGLRVVVAEQAVLDTALGNRIIEFESGKATLADSGKTILDQMSVALMKLKDRKVEVIGHTDNAGSRASNLSLSQARAETVKNYVASRGVAPDLVAVSGEGPDRPVADNRTAEGRARNRRIEFKVIQ